MRGHSLKTTRSHIQCVGERREEGVVFGAESGVVRVCDRDRVMGWSVLSIRSHSLKTMQMHPSRTNHNERTGYLAI